MKRVGFPEQPENAGPPDDVAPGADRFARGVARAVVVICLVLFAVGGFIAVFVGVPILIHAATREEVKTIAPDPSFAAAQPLQDLEQRVEDLEVQARRKPVPCFRLDPPLADDYEEPYEDEEQIPPAEMLKTKKKK